MATQPSTNITELLDRWNSNEGRPYKGELIDWAAYQAQPDNIGCMCAQGQVLHLVAGWSPKRINDTAQVTADRETAKTLNISIAHAVLLRQINDTADGAPAIVLTHPEKVLGDQAQTILAFWRHLDRMTEKQWAAAWDAARDAARAAARDAAWAAAWDAAWAAAWDAARAAAWAAAYAAARDAAYAAAYAAADAAAYAVAEIMGAKVLRDRGQPFVFLPMFGFADPEAVIAADQLAVLA